ncbi:MAG: type VI secretion system tube protein Hcp [Solirubrobacterales bacterium]|nr:type VI secretion system tube protein Hcp [Solirubrobacterales bacterium]
MRISALRWTLLLAFVGVILGGPAAYGALRDEFAPPAAPLPGHAAIAELTMTGRVSGAFRGGGPNGAINVVGLSLGFSQGVDVHSGLVNGKPACSGVEFRKPTDASTPSLFASLATNETIANATFRERGLTITLTNAALSSVRHVVAGTTGAYEDVTLLPLQIEVTWDATGRTAVHRCV